jgi:hypothetical protein
VAFDVDTPLSLSLTIETYRLEGKEASRTYGATNSSGANMRRAILHSVASTKKAGAKIQNILYLLAQFERACAHHTVPYPTSLSSCGGLAKRGKPDNTRIMEVIRWRWQNETKQTGGALL